MKYDSLIKSLESVGLKKKEAEVYVDLLVHGTSKTGDICKRTKIPSSHIYPLLNSLIEKGLVNYKIINNVRYYRASNPDILKNLFEKKELKIREEKEILFHTISKLKALPSDFERMSDYKYYVGVQGIISLYIDITNYWKSGDELLVASAPISSFQRLEGFFMNVVHKKRVENKVKLRIIVNDEARKWGEVRKKLPFTQVRYLNLKTSTEYAVIKDWFSLVNYVEKPYALLIKDKYFSHTFKEFFEILWSNAKE